MAETGDMQQLQELHHGEGFDYTVGSPHLRHRALRDRLTSLIVDALPKQSVARPISVLDVGGGHGGYADAVLARGFRVTATDMSRPAVTEMTRIYGSNSAFRAMFDASGDLAVLGEEKFDAIVCSSVLHHIPDYLSFIDLALGRLNPGGAFVSVQDPLWYPTVGRIPHALDRASYYLWRLTRGGLLRGLKSFGRRASGRYDEANPSDMVEYHAVRKGVDERAIVDLLAPRFETVRLHAYWSTQSSALQALGERMRFPGVTFAVTAIGHRV